MASESPTQIVLKHADGTTTTIDPKQVKERMTAPSSMPEIYGAGAHARRSCATWWRSSRVLTRAGAA